MLRMRDIIIAYRDRTSKDILTGALKGMSLFTMHGIRILTMCYRTQEVRGK